MEYKTVLDGKEGEIVEKKSRFIGAVQHIETEDEALAFIESVRKKHYNARHHCFAYVLKEEPVLKRFSDDGEPQGTAGKPILDVLCGAGLFNTVIVVTRYFGGTLLGTGGLVRAYTQAAREGLANSSIITRKYASKLEIRADYTGLGKIQYLLAQAGIQILDTTYTDAVSMICLVPEDEKGHLEAELTEQTNGKVVMEWGESCYFAEAEDRLLLFES